MPRKPQINRKDMFLLIEGVLLAFMVQLFYDGVREEPIYQNLLPMQYWRAVLTVIVGLIVVWLLLEFSKEPSKRENAKGQR